MGIMIGSKMVGIGNKSTKLGLLVELNSLL